MQVRDFVVERFKQGTLGRLTEPELRNYAFSVHPLAYTDSGLAMVALTAPDLIPVITSIPAKEFFPSSENFDASVKQVFATMERVLPMATGIAVAAMMPAHSGLFQQAVARDRAAFTQDLATGQWLDQTARTIKSGKMDRISLLNRLTDRLNRTQFPDQIFAQRAREIIRAADDRKRRVAAYYRKLIANDPDLRASVDRWDPGWQQW